MSILNWPKSERPREKLAAQGAGALSDAELLAILFGSGTRGQTALDLARSLLVDFKGLRGLISANAERFCERRGLGLSKYALCQAAIELGRRHLQEPIKRLFTITQVRDVEPFLMSQLRDLRNEVFACLFLDNRHRVIEFEKLFYGSIDSTSVHARVLIQRVLHHNAAAVILAHNHPSGVPKPSRADREVTRNLVEALKLIEVRLLDHIIIGDNTSSSLASMGIL